MSPALAAVILKYVTLIIGVIDISAELRKESLKNLDRIKELVELGEDATEEEIAAELARSAELTESIDAIIAQRKAQGA